MSAPLLLLGSTDLTRAVAVRLLAAGVPVAGVVSPPREFAISYSASGVTNARHTDMAAWCRERAIRFVPYAGPDDIAGTAQATGAGLALAAGWYHMVPARVRALFARGCLGIHASLLPRYRGGAPLNWALLNGDAEAGVSLFELADGIDDGPLYDQRRFPIAADEYIGDLVGKAEAAALAMVADVVPGVLDGSAVKRPQEGAPSYALQRQPSDGDIDWRLPAAAIARLVRAVSRPYPGARTTFEGLPLVIWRARVDAGAPRVSGTPGQIVRLPELTGPAVVTGDGLLLVEEVEGPEGSAMTALTDGHQRRLDCVRR